MKRLALLLALLTAFSALAACTPTIPSVTPDQPVPSVVINEVMADNETLTMGHDLDWVELYNKGTVDASLDGFCLTDDPAKPTAYSLKGYSLPAGGYLALPLPEDAPFHLSAKGETVYLTDGKKPLSQLVFGVSENGASFDQNGICEYPTPGYENSKDGYDAYLAALPLPVLMINEVLAANSKYRAVKGNYYDMVEIKNTTEQPVDLGEYTLSDKRSEPDRYSFPSVTLQPGEFYVVSCSGDTALGKDHASFKLSAVKGEAVYIAKNNVITDRLLLPADLPENESYGRSENGYLYYTTPTIGKENRQGYPSTVKAPQANLATGVYDKPQTVTLTGTGRIYYTTDGSCPTEKSALYTAPIKVAGVTTVRAFCVEDGRQSIQSAYTYVIGQSHDLPIVSVSIPQSSLTGKKKGILNHIDKTYEYECQATLIEDGQEKFSLPCGFRLHGNGSREMPKQNFQLRFRSIYGAGKLKYKLFDNRPFDEYNSLLLKGGSEDWDKAVMRDEVATVAVEGKTALYTQAYKPVVLYLGGEYWGIYYLRERFSDDYVASHFEVAEESVDLLFTTGGYAQTGSAADFSALKQYVATHDMSKDRHYQYLCDRIDVTSLIDWYICRSYMGDKDLANIRRFRSSQSDGKWRWMYFDLDWAFVITDDQPVSGIVNGSNGEPELIRALLKHQDGKDLFLKRYAHLLNTVLNEEHMNQVIDTIVSQIETEIPKDRARWERSVSGWKTEVGRLRNYFRNGTRTKRVKDDLQTYFSLTDQEMAAYFEK